jgi:hypothetical protein
MATEDLLLTFLRGTLFAVALAGTIPLTAAPPAAQSAPDPCQAAASPDDASVRLSLKNGQTVFREGEIVDLVLEFTSETTNRYQLSTQTYDRSGRLNAEAFCLTPTSPDPLADYFGAEFLGFIGGGGFSYAGLSAKPYVIAPALNEWRSLRPGAYRLHVVSHRVSRAARKDEPGPGTVSVPLVSNVVAFEVVPASPDWQAETLAGATAALESPAKDVASRGARTLRFLGSAAATRELARRFWSLTDQPLGWDLMFGLVGSPERQTAVDGLVAALTDPSHPVSMAVVTTLALLEIQSRADYVLPPYDPAARDEWLRQRDRKTEAYHQLIAGYLRQLATAVDKKTGLARAVSLDTLLTELPAADPDRPGVRRALISSWDAMPIRLLNDVIGWRWNLVDDPAWLPVLRQIADRPPSAGGAVDQFDRGAALRRLYELAPPEGRARILWEMKAPRTDVGLSVLSLLPDRVLPEIEEPILTRIRAGGRANLDFQLLARYATAGPLPELQRLYEPRRGRWACIPQTALLRYFLRVAPAYGVAEVQDALGRRQFTGCFSFLLPDLKDAVAIPAIEDLAIAALDDAEPGVVSNAASALGRYGSAAAEAPLWRRLEAFHRQWQGRADELRGGPRIDMTIQAEAMIESALVDALTQGQGWICGPDKLERIKDLTTPRRQPILDARMTDWRPEAFDVSLSWPGDGSFSYRVGPYFGDSVDALLQKIAQLPSTMRLRGELTADDETRHHGDVDAIRSAARSAGVRLDLTVK